MKKRKITLQSRNGTYDIDPEKVVFVLDQHKNNDGPYQDSRTKSKSCQIMFLGGWKCIVSHSREEVLELINWE